MSNVDEAEYLKEELDKFEELVKKIEDKHEEVRGCPHPKLCIYQLLVTLFGNESNEKCCGDDWSIGDSEKGYAGGKIWPSEKRSGRAIVLGNFRAMPP